MALSVSIKKQLRDFTLDVSFCVRDDVFALFGASGCGKSITLKCIAGIETPDSGRIVLNGRTLFDSTNHINLPPQARRVGYLFQNYALFPNMTVAQNITFAATGDKRASLRQNIDRFQLHGLENAYPNQLSGGQIQRVALARVIASHAEFLLLDEPFSALDSFLKCQLEFQLADVLKLYRGAILVSHDRGEVFRLADSVAVMQRGFISCVDSKHNLFNHPKSYAAAVLIGYKNISRAHKLSHNSLLALDWNLTLYANPIPDDLAFVAIRDSDLLSHNPDALPLPVINVLEDSNCLIVTLKTKRQPLFCQLDKSFHLSNYIPVSFDKIILLTN